VANHVLREPESLCISMLDLLTAGDNFDGIKKAYPNSIEEDIRACLSYASLLADEEAGATA